MNKQMTKLADLLDIRHDNLPREVLAEQVCVEALERISELTTLTKQLAQTIVESAISWDSDDNNSMNSYPGFYCRHCSMRRIEKKKDIKHDPDCPVIIALAALKAQWNRPTVENGKNRYGLDVSYFRNLFNRELNGTLQNYRPDELARNLLRMARTADESVIAEPEFTGKLKAEWQAEAKSKIFAVIEKKREVYKAVKRAQEHNR